MFNSKIYRAMIVVYGVFMIYRALDRAYYSGVLNSRTVMCYVLLFVAGIVTVLLWNKISGTITETSMNHGWAIYITALVRNCLAVLLLCVWYIAYLYVGNITKAYAVAFGGKEVILLVGISVAIVGVITAVYIFFSKKTTA